MFSYLKGKNIFNTPIEKKRNRADFQLDKKCSFDVSRSLPLEVCKKKDLRFFFR
jgi:hypothetical protein